MANLAGIGVEPGKLSENVHLRILLALLGALYILLMRISSESSQELMR